MGHEILEVGNDGTRSQGITNNMVECKDNF